MPLAAADGLGGTLHERLLPAKEQPGPSDPATQQSPLLAHSDDGRDGTGDQAGDKAKSYWRPSWVVRSLVNAVTFQASWSAGYAAAQLYYSALVIDLGVPNFVTVGPKDMLATAVPRRTALRAFGISMALNLAFGIASYLMVRFQLFLNKRHSGYQKLTVFVAKWVDNVADGATFFSTNITYTALISTLVFSNDTSLLFWELLLFYVLAAAFCVVFTAVLESVPYLWYTEPPTAAALTTNRMISDWYIGQWAWFIAFAGWSCLLSLLGDEYIDVYSSTTAWWLLDLTILLAYIGYAVLPPCCAVGPQIPTKCALACFVALADPTHVDRQGKMLKKSMSWLLGVGLYFTLKKTFPVFADALSLKIVDGGDLTAYVTGTTAVCFLGIFLLELFRQHVNELEHCRQNTAALPGSPSGSEAPEQGKSTGRNHQQPDFKLIEAVESMLKLVFCYITGKAFEAAALADNGPDGGGTVNFALLGFRWQLFAGVAAVIASMWELKTQRYHGDCHSLKCVCTVCHPEYYSDG